MKVKTHLIWIPSKFNLARIVLIPRPSYSRRQLSLSTLAVIRQSSSVSKRLRSKQPKWKPASTLNAYGSPKLHLLLFLNAPPLIPTSAATIGSYAILLACSRIMCGIAMRMNCWRMVNVFARAGQRKRSDSLVEGVSLRFFLTVDLEDDVVGDEGYSIGDGQHGCN